MAKYGSLFGVEVKDSKGISMNEEVRYIYDKILKIEDYKDDTVDETPISLNTPGMINGMAEMALQSPSGDFMEIGVWRGGTASVLHKIAEHQSRKLYLFDLFESEHSLNAVKHFCPNAVLIKGKFPESFPSDLNNISFCMFDIDDDKAAGYLIDMIKDHFVTGGKVLFSYVYRNDQFFKDSNFAVFDGIKYPYLTKA